MNRSPAAHRSALLGALLGAVVGCSRGEGAPDGASPGGSSRPAADDRGRCVSVSCLPRPSAAPSQTAPVFEECDALHGWETALRGPDGKPVMRWEPFSIGQTRDARRAGKPDVCCYEGPGMCGVGRPFVVGTSARTASLTSRGWG